MSVDCFGQVFFTPASGRSLAQNGWREIYLALIYIYTKTRLNYRRCQFFRANNKTIKHSSTGDTSYSGTLYKFVTSIDLLLTQLLSNTKSFFFWCITESVSELTKIDTDVCSLAFVLVWRLYWTVTLTHALVPNCWSTHAPLCEGC